MDLELTQEQQLLRDTIRSSAREELLPVAAKIDETGDYPKEQVARMAELGLMGIAVPDEYGGSGMDYVTYVLVVEEISRVCASTGIIVSVNNSLACHPVLTFGTDEQKQEWLPKLAAGEKIGCFGLTEPDYGSNPGGMLTRARRDGSDWILNGAKMWITNGSIADVSVVWAKDDDDVVQGFLVERDRPGFATREMKRKLSLRASVTSELILQDVRIPDANRLPGS